MKRIKTMTRLSPSRRITVLLAVAAAVLVPALAVMAQSPSVDLAVTKTVDNATPADGATVVYTVGVTNNGPDPATNVVVADPLPAGVTYVSDDGGGAYTGGSWTVGGLASGGSATLNITVTVDANTDGDTVVNTATASATETDSIPENNAASAALTVAIDDLCATTGTTSLPDGATVPVWGYTPGDCTRGLALTAPGGPVIEVSEGDAVSITLHNGLAESSAVLFQGQEMIPDLAGAAAGGTKAYAFTATRPGTYLYEAGLLPNGQHQVAMGLYGAFVVHPAAAGQAYAGATSAYDDAAVLVLSGIDPSLNNMANPANADLRNYDPDYFLINGKAYPDTDLIPSMAGNRVLLRYLNAGLESHAMSVLGADQTIIALDGSELAHARGAVSENIAPGQTADAIVTVPVAAPGDAKLTVYDSSLLLHNSNGVGYGGMLTFITTPPTGPSGSDTVGPLTSNVTATPNPANGTVDVTVTATVSDATTGNSNIAAAELFIDAAGADGTGTAMTGAFAGPVEGVSGTISTAVLSGLSSGPHTIYVHGMDAAGNWGELGFVSLDLDTGGPITSALTLTPNPSDGTVAVALQGSADDSATGGAVVVAAEYTIDGGTAVPMTINLPATTVSLSATIPAGQTEGVHTVAVRAQDDQGNWGPEATIDLVVDTVGPVTSNVNVAPTPNDGTIPINASNPAVRVTADLADASTSVAAAEGFIDTIGADGTGFPLAPVDGAFDSATEAAYADIPLATVALLADGDHTIYVHGQDVAGNWGAASSAVLTVDKAPPVVSGLAATPNPTGGAATVDLTATATDAITGVTAAEWYTGADPGEGAGTAMSVTGAGPWDLAATIDVSAWAAGDYTIYVRAADGLGHWSSPVSIVLTVENPTPDVLLYFSTAGNFAVPGVSGPYDDADIYSWDGSNYARVFDASASGLPGGADIDALYVEDADTFYMSFRATVNPAGPLGNVQDEDIALYDAGTWSLFFDGSDVGLGATSEDVDSFSILPDGSVVVSTQGNGNIGGGFGGFNDEDLIRCTGTFGPTTTCSWSRYFDGSDVSLGAGSEDVDGASVTSAGIYITTTGNFNVGGGNTGTNYDVLLCSAPTTGAATSCSGFSLYFDGSVVGVTNNLDGIHVPAL